MIKYCNYFVVSNKTEEDFGEFLAETSQIITQVTTQGKDFFDFFHKS